ncbi:MAG TPA: DUF6307 family protein [Amycolatopsis sp.]|nr:DUF6307 family protein [Amycolatopsis sp.]
MTSSTVYVSLYEKRVKLVQDVLKKDTKLSDEECQALAVRVLHTLDTVPEKVRYRS